MNHDSIYLIIDDNSIDRKIASMLMEKCMDNPKVFQVEDSNSGIDWIIKNRASFSEKLVILLDMQMPNIDGFGFLEDYEQLDEAFKNRNEIIMLSSMDNESFFTQKAVNNPLVKSVLNKPLDVDELRKVT